MKITFENKIFQIKYKAITLKRFSPLFYLKENPKARLSSIDKYFRKYGRISSWYVEITLSSVNSIWNVIW